MSPVETTGNPYTCLLAEHLQQEHVEVRSLQELQDINGKKHNIIHIHWPEQLLFSSTALRTAIKSTLVLARLWVAKRRGVRIVWTGHNVWPHRKKFRKWYRRKAIEAFLKLVDGVVHLSDTGHRLIENEFPCLNGKPFIRVDHGDLSPAYPPVKYSAARQRLGIDANKRIWLLFGRLKEYRDVLSVVAAFNRAGLPDNMLFICGPCSDATLKKKIEEAADTSEAIEVDLRLLSPLELSTYLSACDIVLQPFTEILHSGSVHLALGYNRRVMAPRRGSLTELQSQIGCRLLHLYEGEFSTSMLSVTNCRNRESNRCNLGNWEVIAKKHRQLYCKLVSG